MDVTFPTHDPYTLADMAAPGARSRTIEGRGKLYLPEGAGRQGPVPGVVLLEGLGGLKSSRELQYGPDLAADGFATLVVDTFGARGADVLSDTKRALTVTEAMMLADAFAGLRFLRGLPEVDPGRVSVMGFSYGGMVTVLAAYDQMRRLYAPDLAPFAGHACYYGCSIPRLDDPTTTGAPVLIQLGELDRNVSVGRSREIAQDLRRGGSNTRLVTYPGTYHQWDSDDTTKRFVRWSLEHLRIRVDRDSRSLHEGTGLRIRGPVSRRLVIATGARPSGYHILRDEDVEASSYETLLEFLDRAGAPAGAALSGDGRDRRPRLGGAA